MNTAGKRGGTEADLSLDELAGCISGGSALDEQIDYHVLISVLNDFLADLPETQRRIFVCRYWYCDSIAEIAQRYSYSESNVKTILLRIREKLKCRLKKEGINL